MCALAWRTPSACICHLRGNPRNRRAGVTTAEPLQKKTSVSILRVFRKKKRRVVGVNPEPHRIGGYGGASRSSCSGFAVGAMNEWESFNVESLCECDLYSPSSQTLLYIHTSAHTHTFIYKGRRPLPRALSPFSASPALLMGAPHLQMRRSRDAFKFCCEPNCHGQWNITHVSHVVKVSCGWKGWGGAQKMNWRRLWGALLRHSAHGAAANPLMGFSAV